jgi:fibronectin type 3 domain-containing protein
MYWDSGKTSISAINEGARSSEITYAGDDLQDDSTYYWRIKFWDNNGAEGVYSTETASFTTAFLNPPATCTLTKDTSNSQITINWADSNTNESGYQIEKNVNSGGFTSLVTKAADSTSHLDTDVSSGNTYQYRIRAEDSEGNTSRWCTTDTLNSPTGNFFFEGLNFEGLLFN